MEPKPKQKRNRWIAAGLTALAGGGLWLLTRNKTPLQPAQHTTRSSAPPFAHRKTTHGTTTPSNPNVLIRKKTILPDINLPNVDSGLVGGAGAESGSALIGQSATSFGGKILGIASGLAGFDMGLAERTRTKAIQADGAYFPPSYALKAGGSLDLNKRGASVEWTQSQRDEVLRQHDEAFAHVYIGAGNTKGWVGLRRARDWLASFKVPLLFANEPPPGHSEGPAWRWYASLGRGFRMAPAITTDDPDVAKKGGAIWTPPDEWATFDPRYGGDTLRQARTGDAAVWDGQEWTPVPWSTWGLQHLIGSGLGAKHVGKRSEWDPLGVFSKAPVHTNKLRMPQNVVLIHTWSEPNISSIEASDLVIHATDTQDDAQNSEAAALTAIVRETFT